MTDIKFKSDQEDIFSGMSDDVRFADLGERARVLEESRVPFILTCQSWQAKGRYIYFWANPSQIEFNFKLRGTTQELKGGTISYQWRANSVERGGLDFYAEPRLNITFQTGNCMPVRTSNSGELIRIPPGLMDFYEFLELQNEPMVLDDGTMNYRILFYNSAIFPNMILTGWIPPDEGFGIQENVEAPNKTSWSCVFIVRKTSPDFKSAAALAYAFKAFSLGADDRPRTFSGANVVGSETDRLAADSQDRLEGTEAARLAGLEATLAGPGADPLGDVTLPDFKPKPSSP